MRTRGSAPSTPGSVRAEASGRSLTTARDLYRAQKDTTFLDSFIRLTAVTNLLLLGQRAAAADSLALVVADSTYPYVSRDGIRVDPFYARMRGVPVFDRLVATP